MLLKSLLCLLVIGSLLLVASAGADHHQSDEAAEAALSKALAHPDRPEADKQRDADRKPAEVLKFFGIKPGMVVADMMAGGGYYTEIVARTVGDEGKVFAMNNSIALKRFADKAIGERLKDNRLPNVARIDSELETPGFPEGKCDAVLLFLFYHDTYWMKADREKMNKAIFDSLKPGGLYCVTDHHAEKDSKDRDVQTLHRVDAQMVKAEILAAGFEFVAESDLLSNPEDNHTINVFKPDMRGKTDRFIYKFRRPVKTN